jgi:hypothetical protein
METIKELLAGRRKHVKRLSNQKGANAELGLFESGKYKKRPTGKEMKALLEAFVARKLNVKKSGFDAILVPEGITVDFSNTKSILASFDLLKFIEIKSTSKEKVKPGFGGYYFAFTESEMEAAEALGAQHMVLLVNTITGEKLATTIPELLKRASSKTWQMSVQLKKEVDNQA